jgi:outer membrane protein OmpA-like peptidoglycan-associated protein
MKRHWRTITAFVALVLPLSVVAQDSDNMVFNPSFEEYCRCPDRIDAVGILNGVDAWWQPTAGSSDYFNVCGGRECNVPRNKMGFQPAHTGVAYCGIYCSQESYREYLQTQLKAPLVAGKRYRVSFYVSLAEKSPHAIATIGALLSSERISDSTWDILMSRETTSCGDNQSQSIAIYYKPQVVNDKETVLSDPKAWTLVSGEFVAVGGERFLTIGNFNSFNNSVVVESNQPNAVLQGAYYYIDDVSVVSAEPILEPETAEEPMLKEGDVVSMWDVYFATGESDVMPQSYVELRRLVELLQSNPTMIIELRGHTDDQGTREFNRRLSEARAQAVVDYLVAHGIDRRRLSAVGYGESRPVDTNDTPEGRSRNRRVEYLVVHE